MADVFEMNSRTVLTIVASLALVAGGIAFVIFQSGENVESASPRTRPLFPSSPAPGSKADMGAQRESQLQAIEHTRRISAKRIDPALPNLPLEDWLLSVLPPSSKIVWGITDCGEQSGDPAVDKAREIPVCVTASAEIGKERLDISFAFGSWESDGTADPHVFFISFGQGSDFLAISQLSSLPSFRDAPQAPADAALHRMRWIRKLLDTQRPDAGAWWHMQKAAETLGAALPTLSDRKCYDENIADPQPGCPGVALAQEARQLGINFEYCWPGEAWLVGNEGYVSYLELWPTGPNADEAFWRTQIEPPCCDECGQEFRDHPSREQILRACKEFLEKFPQSHLRGKAEEMIRAVEKLKTNP